MGGAGEELAGGLQQGCPQLMAAAPESEPPDLPASSLAARPHRACEGLGWERETEELLKTKLPAWFLLFAG